MFDWLAVDLKSDGLYFFDCCHDSDPATKKDRSERNIMQGMFDKNRIQKNQQDISRITHPVVSYEPSRRMSSSLLVVTLIMVSFGLIMLFSASMSDGYASQSGNSMYYVLRQSGITAMGLTAAFILAVFFPVRFFEPVILTALLYFATTGLLIYVRLFGVVINNARRWVSIGIMFQPSELAKLAIIFCFAGYTAWIKRQRQRGRFHFRSGIIQFFADGWIDILLPGLAMLVWIILVALQPHLSGALILAFIGLAVFLIAGLPLHSWASAVTQILVLLLIVLLVFSWLLPMLPVGEWQASLEQNFAHVTRRLETFSDPEGADSDATYQIDQSIIAIGSGGMSGLGLGEGRQKYNYLPEAHNDFVFAIIGEELGFIGSVAVILLFLSFMFIGIGITLKASAPFATLLAGGYTMLITIQALLNIGVATRTLPPTGISLPFFSYGGTSNLFFLLAIGFILAVSKSGLAKRQKACERSGRQAMAKSKISRIHPKQPGQPGAFQTRKSLPDKERAIR